ncbi:MAG: hypothetical protein A2355_16560 [Spirochaetes bacterium RIFOXYB1_FULL_32_8]|nr:MAG: hypothetical protein A2355_16560 [Spirochaetes bacterium RIFOXYB1_FULL_32_8]
MKKIWISILFILLNKRIYAYNSMPIIRVGSSFSINFEDYLHKNLLSKTEEKIYTGIDLTLARVIHIFSKVEYSIALKYSSSDFISKFRVSYIKDILRVKILVNKYFFMYAGVNPSYGLEDYYYRNIYSFGGVVQFKTFRFSYTYSGYHKNTNDGEFDQTLVSGLDWVSGKKIYAFHSVKLSARFKIYSVDGAVRCMVDSLKCNYEIRFDIKKIFDSFQIPEDYNQESE